MSRYLYRLARWCYEHRRRVLVAWVVVAAVVISLGVAGHGKQNDNITIPGTESP
jgi:RND superfamily putative drug exporter